MARSRGHRRHGGVREAAPPRYASPPPAAALTGVLLDSDVVIDVLRGRVAVVDELRFAGVRTGEEERTEAFFEARGEIAIDATTGRRAGVYLSRYSIAHSRRTDDS